MKYILVIMCFLSINTFAESIHFKIISMRKLQNMEEKGTTLLRNDLDIKIDMDINLLSTHNNTKHFEVVESSSSEEEEGKYFNLTFLEKKRFFIIKRKVSNYVTILFPSDPNELIIIIITDKFGNGWFYYAEVI